MECGKCLWWETELRKHKVKYVLVESGEAGNELEGCGKQDGRTGLEF